MGKGLDPYGSRPFPSIGHSGMGMENMAFSWRPCRSCKNGRVALFTSVVTCDECAGTGVDLSDDRLNMKLESLMIMVRTRKLLHRFGVDTVKQLLCVVASGRLTECDINCIGNSTVVLDIRNLLLRSGLRAREDGVIEDVRGAEAGQ